MANALHNLSARKKKKRKTVVVLKHTLRLSPLTLTSLWIVFSLSTLYFKLNFLCEFFWGSVFWFLDANADWYMLKQLKNSQKRFTFRIKRGQAFFILSCFAFIAAPALPTCVLTFTPPQNFHATREEILYAEKPIRSKNNFRAGSYLEGLRWMEGLMGD